MSQNSRNCDLAHIHSRRSNFHGCGEAVVASVAVKIAIRWTTGSR